MIKCSAYNLCPRPGGELETDLDGRMMWRRECKGCIGILRVEIERRADRLSRSGSISNSEVSGGKDLPL